MPSRQPRWNSGKKGEESQRGWEGQFTVNRKKSRWNILPTKHPAKCGPFFLGGRRCWFARTRAGRCGRVNLGAKIFLKHCYLHCFPTIKALKPSKHIPYIFTMLYYMHMKTDHVISLQYKYDSNEFEKMIWILFFWRLCMFCQSLPRWNNKKCVSPAFQTL